MSKHYRTSSRRGNDSLLGLGNILNNMNINQLLAVVLALRGENISAIAPLLMGNGMEGMDFSKLAGAVSGGNNFNADNLKNMMGSLNLQDIDMEKISDIMRNLNLNNTQNNAQNNTQSNDEKKHKKDDVVDVKFEEVKGIKPKMRTLAKDIEKGKYSIDDETIESSYNLIKVILEKANNDKLYDDVLKLCEK